MQRSKSAVIVVAVCLVVTVAAVAYAAGKAKPAVPVQEVVRAQRFELVDAEGRVRGALSVALGSPVLTLADEKGTVRAALGAPSLEPGKRISLNEATAEELESLPGIGPVYAQRIIAYREQKKRAEGRGFESVDELLNVPGIDPKRLAGLRDRVETTRTAVVEKRPESFLVLFDPEGKVLWSAP